MEVDSCYVRGDGDITAGLTPLTLTPTQLSQERDSHQQRTRELLCCGCAPCSLLSAHLLAPDTFLITAEPNNNSNSPDTGSQQSTARATRQQQPTVQGPRWRADEFKCAVNGHFVCFVNISPRMRFKIYLLFLTQDWSE